MNHADQAEPRDEEVLEGRPTPDERAARNPYLTFPLRAGAGLAVVAFLLWHYDARPVLQTLGRERPVYFIAAVALFLTGQLISSLRWRLLGKIAGLDAPFREYLTYYFIGMFTNVFVPGLVGGDAARAIYLGRRNNRLAAAVASVVADRGVGLLALFWLAAAAAAMGAGSRIPHSVSVTTIGLGIALLAGYVAMIAAAGPAERFVERMVERLPARFAHSLSTVRPYLRRPMALMPALGLSMLVQVALVICQWLLALGLGLDVPLGLFMLCVPVANVFASLPITLNGLGVRETAYLMLLGTAGVAHHNAIALGLLWFVATALGNFTGVIAFIFTDAPQLRESGVGRTSP